MADESSTWRSPVNLFISYSRDDGSFVEALRDRLLNHGFTIWSDSSHLPSNRDDFYLPGDQNDQSPLPNSKLSNKSLYHELEQCEIILIVLSPSYIASAYCKLELEHAEHLLKPLVPLQLKHTNSAEALNCRQYIDFTRGFNTGLIQLLDKLNHMSHTNFTKLRNHLLEYTKSRTEAESPETLSGIRIGAFLTSHQDENIFGMKLRQALNNAAMTSNDLADRLNVEVELIEAILDGTLLASELDPDFLVDISTLAGLNLNEIATKKSHLLLIVNRAIKKPRQEVGAATTLKPDIELSHGIGLTSRGLPELVWCAVPASKITTQTCAGINNLVIQSNIEHFYITKYPITNIQFQAFMDAEDGFANDHWWKGFAQRQPEEILTLRTKRVNPRTQVSWYAAMAFCRWLNQQWKRGNLDLPQGIPSNYQLRLPTDIEWELAVRGTDERQSSYPWESNIGGAQQDIGGHCDLHTKVSTLTTTAENNMVVIGNLWEWTSMKYETQHSNERIKRDCQLAESNFGIICKDCTCIMHRKIGNPHEYHTDIGFRVVYAPALSC